MTATRRGLLFSAEGIFLLSVYSLTWWAVSSALYRANPGTLGTAVLLDLTLTAGLIHYLFGIRGGKLPSWTVLPVMGTGYTVARLWLPELANQGAGVFLVIVAAVELGAVVLVLIRVSELLRAYRKAKLNTPFAWQAFERSLAEVSGSPKLAKAVRLETELFWLALSGWFRKPQFGAHQQPFTVYRKISWVPMLGALLFFSFVEFGVIHYFLLQAGWTSVAAVSLILHLYGFLWLIGDAQALRLRPILVSSDTLEIQLGLRWNCSVPRELVKSAEPCPNPAGDGFPMVLFGSPNVCLRLEESLTITGLFGIQRQSDCLLLQLDDPQGFCATLQPER